MITSGALLRRLFYAINSGLRGDLDSLAPLSFLLAAILRMVTADRSHDVMNVYVSVIATIYALMGETFCRDGSFG